MSFKKSFGRTDLHEVVNIRALKYIVKNWGKFSSLVVKNNENDYEWDPKLICQKYISKYDKVAVIKYKKSSKYPSKIGRWFCTSGIGLQSMPRVIRHTICDGLYIDLDFKNAHPKILEQICAKNKIKCEFLSQYNQNRDNLLSSWSSHLNFTKDEVKTIFLSALNGNATRYNIPDWDKILKEFRSIHKKVSLLDQYKEISKEVEEHEKSNINAKIVNRILCVVENDCLQALYDFLDKKGIFNVSIDDHNHKICALIFDGLQIPLNDETEKLCTAENLKTCSAVIQNKTGFYLDLVRKPFDEKLDIPENIEDTEEDDNDQIIVKNDGDAAEHIVSKFSQYMINCNGVRYVKYGNIWSCDNKIVESTLYGWIFRTPMAVVTMYGGLKSYNRDKSSIHRCLDVIWNNWVNFIPNKPLFIDDLLFKSKEYLPFANGVYSMRDQKLVSYEDCPVQFTQIITRDFPEFNQEAHNTMMEKIIVPILPDEEERKYFLYVISRALAGKYEDKKWYINKGSRNSGKGVITNLVSNAFKVFVGTFNSGSLIRKKNENADEAKNLSWVVKLKDKRLIFSNEVQEDAVLNGKMLKQLASGGDTMLGRVNYQDEIEFTPQFTLMLQLNNLKGVEPHDALESCEQFYCKSKFVSKEELIEDQPFLKLKDENIKSLIEQPEIIDAFTLYILNHFQDKLTTPESVKLSTNDMQNDIPITLEQIILKHFRRTKNPNDKLFTLEIQELIGNICKENDYECSVDTKELASVILKTGIGLRPSNDKITKQGKKLSGYTNIVCVESNLVEDTD